MATRFLTAHDASSVNTLRPPAVTPEVKLTGSNAPETATGNDNCPHSALSNLVLHLLAHALSELPVILLRHGRPHLPERGLEVAVVDPGELPRGVAAEEAVLQGKGGRLPHQRRQIRAPGNKKTQSNPGCAIGGGDKGPRVYTTSAKMKSPFCTQGTI